MGKKFGEYLKSLRDDRQLTLRDVERMEKISNAYLSQIERGERGIPTIKTLNKLAKAYGVPIAELTKKAEEELTKKANNNAIQAPNTEFICRGYENLKEENKQALKKFLQSLTRDEKEQNKK